MLKTALIPIVVFIAAYCLKKRLLNRNPQNVVLLNFTMYAAFLFILTIKHFIFQRVALIFFPAIIYLLPEIVCSVQVDPEKTEELTLLQQADRGRRKQASAKETKLRTELRDQKALYYAAIGFVLAVGLLYYAFLLQTNRLLLVPYVTLF